jgi:hypothetical protein
MRLRFAPRILAVCILFLSPNAHAQWQVDGLPICTAANSQGSPTVVSDGAGGAIVTWFDYRNGSTPDIYAQRLDALGIPQWAADGVALCTVSGFQLYPMIASDGVGGAIVTWIDTRSGGIRDIYIQRVSALGIPQWTADGVALCTATNNQWNPRIVADGTGGAIVTWYDLRSGASHIYAQRVNAAGVPHWTADGVPLCTATNEQNSPTIAPDDAGGAIVTWQDYRNGNNNDIYVQRVNAAGTPQWTADGVALCLAAKYQFYPAIAPDGTGGAIITWRDERSGTADIYAQRVNASGVAQWTVDGVALCTAMDYQVSPMIVSDGTGGAIVAWEDYRIVTSTDIYAQRVTASGLPQWMADGVALCTAADRQESPQIVSDGASGAIVTWTDSRPGGDLYIQRVNASGIPQWTADGAAICTAANSQANPSIISDATGGAIVTWEDTRNGGYDVYAQRVTDPLNAVAILSFDASETDGVVTLRSTFRSDLGIEAVNIYRAVGTNDHQLIVIERVDDVHGDRFEYIDRDVAPGQSYRYRIGVIDGDGEFFSPVVTVSVKPITTQLSQNQPNPFNPTTTIHFVLPMREDATLAIYDTNGHLVRTLVNGIQGYGAHEVSWDGRDDNGATMGSGVYFYRLRAGKLTESKKMVLLK